MNERKPTRENDQPIYETLEALLGQISGNNGQACRKIYQDFETLFRSAPGSSHNHQCWPGGYYDHVSEVMNLAALLYDTLNSLRPLPFNKSDALLVMFLHDLEKPFKYVMDDKGQLTRSAEIIDKAGNAAKRNQLLQQYGIELNAQQTNAMRYVEGVREKDYVQGARTMGELAALCHSADTLSARLWYNYPLPEGKDEWSGARRINNRVNFPK